jgi:hypothetical protein
MSMRRTGLTCMVIPRQGTVDDELVIDQFQFFLHMFVSTRLGLADVAERSVVAKRCATPRVTSVG